MRMTVLLLAICLFGTPVRAVAVGDGEAHYNRLIKESNTDCTLFSILAGDEKWINAYAAQFMTASGGTIETLHGKSKSRSDKLAHLSILTKVSLNKTAFVERNRKTTFEPVFESTRLKTVVNFNQNRSKRSLGGDVNLFSDAGNDEDYSDPVFLYLEIITKMDELHPLDKTQPNWSSEAMVIEALKKLNEKDRRFAQALENATQCQIKSTALRNSQEQNSNRMQVPGILR